MKYTRSIVRWASITDLYRQEVLGEKGILPPGVC